MKQLITLLTLFYILTLSNGSSLLMSNENKDYGGNGPYGAYEKCKDDCLKDVEYVIDAFDKEIRDMFKLESKAVIKIDSAEMQLVAGNNYKVDLQITDDGVTYTETVNYYVGLNDKLPEKIEQDFDKADSSEHINTFTLTNNSLPMKNAAKKGMLFPIIGLGTKGPGYKLGQKEECWYWPKPCCTSDHCPAVDATKQFINLANSKGLVARIDSGYPYGDNANENKSGNGCPDNPYELNGLEGGHPSCNTMGIGKGIKASGAKRSDVFVTIKTGYAGPMGKSQTQIKSTLHNMQLDYADLCLIHEPEVGPGTGGHGEYGDYHCNSAKSDYNAKKCRVNTYAELLNTSFKAKGWCKSVGVNNWNMSDVKELEEAGLLLPSVVQYKFHLHQSLASPWQKDLMDYCEEKGIIFNGIAPLGTPDWVTFTGDGMKATALDEPKVQDIANKVGKSAAQVLQRWIIQQGIAIQTRSMDEDHMKENLDVFDWELADDDMQTLSSFPQCSVQRGNPYMDGDPNGGSHHGNVVGMTQHC